MESQFFVDLHCHPSVKAFAKSFKKNPGQQSNRPKDISSMWRRDAPSTFDKVKNRLIGITNFIQSDAASLIRGRVGVVCISLYPQEKAFFNNRLGSGIPSDTLVKLATEYGQQRIDHIQQMSSYWEDLILEMNFLKQREHTKIKIDGKVVTYQVARSYKDIELADKNGELGETKILFVPTIEGVHVFDQMIDSNEPWDKHPDGIPNDRLQIILQRLKDLRGGKNGLLRPAFMTFAHHFWNGLCGHARSFGGLKCAIDQDNGISRGFFSAGKVVANAMLREEIDENGNMLPPIIIDIKHMCRTSREQYFEFLATEFPDRNIPILVSHGCVTGLSYPDGRTITSIAQEEVFNLDDINFFDDELLKIEDSRGVFGIQLDERRIGSKSAIRKAQQNIRRRDVLYEYARLVWNQIRHIAEVLDLHGKYAWGIQALGTDFDGIIDPIDGYWTSKDLNDLDDYLLMHAFDYLKEVKMPCPLTQTRNRVVEPDEVVERVMTSNALNFISRIY